MSLNTRDASENRSIVLMKFRHRDDAEEFALAYNGREFNSIEVRYGLFDLTLTY